MPVTAGPRRAAHLRKEYPKRPCCSPRDSADRPITNSSRFQCCTTRAACPTARSSTPGGSCGENSTTPATAACAGRSRRTRSTISSMACGWRKATSSLAGCPRRCVSWSTSGSMTRAFPPPASWPQIGCGDGSRASWRADNAGTLQFRLARRPLFPVCGEAGLRFTAPGNDAEH